MALADQLIGVLSVFTDLKNRDTYRILSYSIKSMYKRTWKIPLRENNSTFPSSSFSSNSPSVLPNICQTPYAKTTFA